MDKSQKQPKPSMPFLGKPSNGMVSPGQAAATRECQMQPSVQPNDPIREAVGENPFEPVGMN